MSILVNLLESWTLVWVFIVNASVCTHYLHYRTYRPNYDKVDLEVIIKTDEW